MKMGILGAARVVDLAITGKTDGLFDVVALAARDGGRARLFADARGIPRAYGAYEELLADPEIEVVYNALPCSEHMPFTLQALQQGKHVLCEKPFALDLASATHAVELARAKHLTLMEAHHWRYHPLVAECERVAHALPRLERMEARFVAGLNNPTDIRKDPALGAGVTMDFGCYLVQWVRFMAQLWGTETRPEVRAATMVEEQQDVDVAAEIVLGFGEVEAHLHCDMRDGTPFEAFVSGEGGNCRLLFENPLGVEGARVTLQRGGEAACFTEVPTTTYRRQLEAFRASVEQGRAAPTSGDDTLETQRLLDEIYQRAGLSPRIELARRARSVQPG